MAINYYRCGLTLITAITRANPGQVTTYTAHGLSNGDTIAISNVGGMTQVNNLKFTVTVVNSTNFTIGVDTSAYTTYARSGYVHTGIGTGTYRGPWLASTAFALNDQVISNTVTSMRMHECTTAGTTGAAQPSFNTTPGNTTADNTVIWTTRQSDSKTYAFYSLQRTTGTKNDFVYAASDSIDVPNGSINASPSLISVNWSTLAYEKGSTLCSIGNISFNAGGLNGGYVYGFLIRAGIGATAANIDLQSTATGSTSVVIVFNDCTFSTETTNATATLYLGANSTFVAKVRYKNCSFKLGQTGHVLLSSIGQLIVDGGGIASDSAVITNIQSDNTNLALRGYFTGVDFSRASATATIGGGANVYRNCKMPASWTPSYLAAGSGSNGFRSEFYNCVAGGVNYSTVIRDSSGLLTTETTNVITGGSPSDGTTPITWKITPNNNNNAFTMPFYTPEFTQWNATTGSAITVTVEILTSSSTFTNKDAWLEVVYFSESGSTLGTIASSGADILDAGTALTTSTANWVTTGVSTPNKYKLSVTFTPQLKGPIYAKVYYTRTSGNIYVNPLMTIS